MGKFIDWLSKQDVGWREYVFAISVVINILLLTLVKIKEDSSTVVFQIYLLVVVILDMVYLYKYACGNKKTTTLAYVLKILAHQLLYLSIFVIPITLLYRYISKTFYSLIPCDEDSIVRYGYNSNIVLGTLFRYYLREIVLTLSNILLPVFLIGSWKYVINYIPSQNFFKSVLSFPKAFFGTLKKSLLSFLLLLLCLGPLIVISYVYVTYFNSIYEENWLMAVSSLEKLTVFFIFYGGEVFMSICFSLIYMTFLNYLYGFEFKSVFFVKKKNILTFIVIYIIYFVFIGLAFGVRYNINLNYYKNLLFEYEYLKVIGEVERNVLNIDYANATKVFYKDIAHRDKIVSDRLVSDGKHIYLDNAVIVKEADLESFLVVNEYYAKDKSNIYYLKQTGEYIFWTTSDSLEFVCGSRQIDGPANDYCSDGTRIYYEEKIFDQFDAQTFEVLYKAFKYSLVSDKNGTYIIRNDEVMRVNSKTSNDITIIGPDYYREVYFSDRYYVYYSGLSTPDKIVATFNTHRFLNPYRNELIYAGIYIEKNDIYAFDAENIYVKGVIVGRNLDFKILSLEKTDTLYAKNIANVYYQGEIIVDADLASFRVLNKWYAVDKNNVYYEKDVIPGADKSTFTVHDALSQTAYDTNNYYVKGVVDSTRKP